VWRFAQVRSRLAVAAAWLVILVGATWITTAYWLDVSRPIGRSTNKFYKFLRILLMSAQPAPVVPAPGDKVLELAQAPGLAEAHGWKRVQGEDFVGGWAVSTRQGQAELTFPVDLAPDTYTLFLRGPAWPGLTESRVEVEVGGQTCTFAWRIHRVGNVAEPARTISTTEQASRLRLRVIRAGNWDLVLDRLLIRPGAAEGDGPLAYLGMGLAVAALLLSGGCWGAFLWGRLGLGEQADPLARLVLLEGLGLGLLATSTTVLGIAGWFCLPVVLALLAGGAVVGGRALGRTLRAWLAEQRQQFSFRHTLVAGLLLVGMVALATAALAPATGMDPQLYHLPIAKWLIAEGGYHYHPYQMAWAYPHNISNLFAVTQLLDNDAFFRTAQLTHASLGALWLVSVYALGKTLFGRATGLAAGMLCVAIDGVAWEFSGAVVDLGFAFFAGASLLAFVKALAEETEEARGRWLTLAALLAGAAAACKVNGPALAVALALAAGMWLGRRRGWRAGLGWFCVIGLVAFAVASPMYLKNWLLYGNPVYPFTTLFPNRDLPPEAQHAWFVDQRETDWRIMSTGPYSLWLWPYAWVLGKFMEPTSPGPGVLVGVMLLPLLGRRWRRCHWPLLLAVAVQVALWLAISPLTRFSYPWAAVLLVVACAPLSRRDLRWPGVFLPAALVYIALVAIALQSQLLLPQWVHVARRQSNQTYLRWIEPATRTLSSAQFDDIQELNREYRQQPWQGCALIDAVHLAYADFPTVPAPTYLWNRTVANPLYAPAPGTQPYGPLAEHVTLLSDRELLQELTVRLQVRRVLFLKPAGNPLTSPGQKQASGPGAPPERRLDLIFERWSRCGLVQRRELSGTVLYCFDEDMLHAVLHANAGQAAIGVPRALGTCAN
jgi:hypothetical protein